jgi:hypothetical protein
MVQRLEITVIRPLCYLIKLRVVYSVYTSGYLSLPAVFFTAVRFLALTCTFQLRVHTQDSYREVSRCTVAIGLL